MQEPYRKDLASHPGPEPCAGGREIAGEALAGVHAGRVWSCEINVSSRVPTVFTYAEGHIVVGDTGKPWTDPAQSKTPRTRGSFSHGNRETPGPPLGDGPAGRSEKATSRSSDMHGPGESDGSIVPKKPANKDAVLKASAEQAEERGPTKGNTEPSGACRTHTSMGLVGVRRAARRDGRARFTALRRTSWASRMDTAPGEASMMRWTPCGWGFPARR